MLSQAEVTAIVNGVLIPSRKRPLAGIGYLRILTKEGEEITVVPNTQLVLIP